MGFFDYFPYTNFHELNLNWLLAKVKDLHAKYLLQEATLEQIQQEIKNLDVPEIVKEQINDMVTSGQLTDLFTPTWKELFTQNKKFYLGDLYVISENAVSRPAMIGHKFAHYDNILYTWDNQLLQLTNTLTNMPSSTSASVVFIVVETMTPGEAYSNFCTWMAKNFTGKFPNAYIYLAGIKNYQPQWHTNYIITNAMLGENRAEQIGNNIERILSGTETFIHPIRYINQQDAKIGSLPENALPSPKSLGTPAQITNHNGRIYTQRWYYTGELSGTVTYDTLIPGFLGNGLFINSERGALWNLSNRNSNTITISLINPAGSQLGTNTMYSAETILI